MLLLASLCLPIYLTQLLGMHAGKGYVDVSTVDAGTAQKIAKVLTCQTC